jgi:flagellar basal body rod protein FlgG
MISIRSILFIAMPLITVLATMATQLRRCANDTVDWQDLSVSGRGYIHTVDENGNNPVWLRYARLTLNANSQLCAKVDSEYRLLEPPITVPSDWIRIDIDTYGRVTVNTPGSAGLSIGSIQLTTFSGEEIGDPISTTNVDDHLGPPMIQEPGVSGAGHLMQRSSLQYCLPFTSRTILIIGFPMILLTAGIWYTWRKKKP